MINNRRNLFKLAGAAAVAALSLGVSTTTALAADVTLRMHQFLPAQANVPKHMLDVWADKVEAESNGRIEIQRFPSMQLGGKPPHLYDQVVDGVADIVWTVAGYTPGRFPRTEVFELPFTMTSAESMSKAYWELAEETMLDQDFKDVKIIALWVHGPGLIHSSKPITSVKDLNGVKLRAPTRVVNKMVTELGATAVGMPVPAVPEALSKGVIDATVIPWEVTGALKVPELVKNHTEFGNEALYTTTFIFAMNKGRYNAMPDDLKAVIDANSGLDMSAWMGKTMAGFDAKERAKAVELGNNIITLDDAQVAEWKAAASSIADDWAAELDGKGLDGTGLRARAAELLAKHSGN